MITKNLTEEWEDFSGRVLKTWRPESLKVSKTIFFAGAYAMYCHMGLLAKIHGDSEEGADAIGSLVAECTAAFNEIPGFADSDGGEPD